MRSTNMPAISQLTELSEAVGWVLVCAMCACVCECVCWYQDVNYHWLWRCFSRLLRLRLWARKSIFIRANVFVKFVRDGKLTGEKVHFNDIYILHTECYCYHTWFYKHRMCDCNSPMAAQWLHLFTHRFNHLEKPSFQHFKFFLFFLEFILFSWRFFFYPRSESLELHEALVMLGEFPSYFDDDATESGFVNENDVENRKLR